MKKRFFLFLCLLAPITGFSQSVDELLQQFDNQIIASDVEAATATLEQAAKADGKNYEVLWRQSRLMILIGDRQPEKEQLSYYEKSLDFANMAVKANKKGSAGYTRRAAANGKLALFQGVMSSNSYVNAVRDDAEKSIKNKADGDIDLAAANYILGRTHLKLNETPYALRYPLDLEWGNIEEALEYLEKATKLRPNFLMYHLEYARALKVNGDKVAAKKQLEIAIAAQNQEPGDDERRKEAQQLLASL